MRSQDAGRSSCTTKVGSFEATRSWHEECGPRAKEQSLSAKFAAWFDTTFADSIPQWKQKAIQASREAASVVLMKAQHYKEKPAETSDAYRPKANLSHKTTQLEYWAEIEDLHLITEFGEDDQPTRDKAAQWQDELNRIHPKKSSRSRGTCLGVQSLPQMTDQPQPIDPLESTGQFPIQYWDVQLKDRRCIKFLKPPSTQTVKPKKISLKEYLDHKPTQATSTMTTAEHQGDDYA